MVKQNWSDISSEPISEEAVRALHLPAEKYRLYPNSYGPGVSFPTTVGQPVVLYVLQGRCKYKLGDREVTLQASEFVPLEKGSYSFEVLGSAGVKLVKVFKLS
jgi:hypothetical protein